VTAPRDYRDFVVDIVEACRALIAFVEGMTLEAFLADQKTRFAVMRGFEMLGEAVRHIPDEIKSVHPDIPWADMTAFRNRIVHGYFGINDSILFSTIQTDLRPLLPKVEQFARGLGIEV